MTKKLFGLTIATALATSLMAGQKSKTDAVEFTKLQVPVASRHFDGDFDRIRRLNEKNQGLVVNFKVPKIDVVQFKIGTWRNYKNSQSFFAGVEKGFQLGDFIEVGATAGLATGYDNPLIGGGFIETTFKTLMNVRADVTHDFEKNINTVGLSAVFRF